MLSDMSFEMDFDPLWHQAFSAFLTTTAQYVATRFGCHPSSEAELLLTGSF